MFNKERDISSLIGVVDSGGGAQIGGQDIIKELRYAAASRQIWRVRSRSRSRSPAEATIRSVVA